MINMIQTGVAHLNDLTAKQLQQYHVYLRACEMDAALNKMPE
jgi:hypothetical protein